MEAILPSSEVIAEGLSITDKITKSFQAAYTSYSGLAGWELIEYPRGQYIICNVPATGGSVQFVYATRAGGWCRFRDVDAHSWGILNEDIYFGDNDGNVVKFDVKTYEDNGDFINYAVQPAFSDFGTYDEKFMTWVESSFRSTPSINPAVEGRADYNVDAVVSTVPQYDASGSPWDTSPWDTTPWGDALRPAREWHKVNERGTRLSYRVEGSLKGSALQIAQTRAIWRKGRIF